MWYTHVAIRSTSLCHTENYNIRKTGTRTLRNTQNGGVERDRGSQVIQLSSCINSTCSVQNASIVFVSDDIKINNYIFESRNAIQ